MPARSRTYQQQPCPTGELPSLCASNCKAVADQHGWCCKSCLLALKGTNICMSAHKYKSTPILNMQLDTIMHTHTHSFSLHPMLVSHFVIVTPQQSFLLTQKKVPKLFLEDALVRPLITTCSHASQITADTHI